MPSIAEVPTSCISKKRRRDDEYDFGNGGVSVEVQMKLSR